MRLNLTPLPVLCEEKRVEKQARRLISLIKGLWPQLQPRMYRVRPDKPSKAVFYYLDNKISSSSLDGFPSTENVVQQRSWLNLMTSEEGGQKESCVICHSPLPLGLRRWWPRCCRGDLGHCLLEAIRPTCHQFTV